MNIKQFEFGGTQRTVLLAGMALGLVCLIAQYLTGDQYHTEFWSSLLQNTVYFTGIAFTAVFFLAANITGFGGWITTFRRLWEHMGGFMLWMLVPLAILVAGVWGHLHHLYEWNVAALLDPESEFFDSIIAGKSAFLNPTWYTVAAIGFVAIWYLVAKKIRDISLASDDSSGMDIDSYKKTRKWSALYLPLAGFLSPAFYWLLMMSIDPHWYSTMYAWYCMVSGWLGALAFTVMAIIYLKSQGYMEYVNREHLHDLGKYLFGITIFWTYLWFDQFMLIWYSNNGEETIYFKERMEHYPVLFWGNLLINFITPFFMLMRNDTKRKFGTLFVAAALIFFGHWWDYFYMVKPGARIAAFEASVHDGSHSHDAAAIHVDEAHAAHGDSHAGHSDGHNAHDAHGHGDDHHGAAHNDGTRNRFGIDITADAAHHPHHPTEFKIGYTIPGFLDLGIMLGFFSLLSFFVLGRLSRSPMIPVNDPFLEEAIHHHTGAHIDAELAEGGAGHH